MQNSRIQKEVIELFDGDKAKADHWLNTPKRALGGRTPAEHSVTGSGAQAVRTLIRQLQHGIVV